MELVILGIGSNVIFNKTLHNSIGILIASLNRTRVISSANFVWSFYFNEFLVEDFFIFSLSNSTTINDIKLDSLIIVQGIFSWFNCIKIGL